MQLVRITGSTPEWHDRFFAHVRDVFPGADFEVWTRAGGWTSRYDVLAFVAGDEIVATAGRTRMVLSIAGEGREDGFRSLREGIQLGAVGVKAEFRGEGTGRRLLSIIIQEAERMNQPVFLFSNRAARGFYSRLGFTGVENDLVLANLAIRPHGRSLRRLDPNREEDRRLISDAVASSSSHRGALTARSDLPILLWYLFNTPVKALATEDGLSVIFVEDEVDGGLAIREWLGERPRDLLLLLPHLSDREINRLSFGFIPPEAWFEAGLVLASDMDSNMFIRGLAVPDYPLCFPHLLRT